MNWCLLGLGLLVAFVVWAMVASARAERAKMEAIEAREPDYTYDTYVAGVTFEDRQEAVLAVKLGRYLTLMREPKNEHDPNAVALWWKSHQVGYIPQFKSRMAAEYLDSGRVVTAKVTGFADAPGDRDALGLQIRLSFYPREEKAAAIDATDRTRS